MSLSIGISNSSSNETNNIVTRNDLLPDKDRVRVYSVFMFQVMNFCEQKLQRAKTGFHKAHLLQPIMHHSEKYLGDDTRPPHRNHPRHHSWRQESAHQTRPGSP